MKKVISLFIVLVLAVSSFSALLVNAAEVDVDSVVDQILDGSISFWDIEDLGMSDEQFGEFYEKLENKVEEATKGMTDEEKAKYVLKILDPVKVIAELFKVDSEQLEADLKAIYGDEDLTEALIKTSDVLQNIPLGLSTEFVRLGLKDLPEDATEYDTFLAYIKQIKAFIDSGNEVSYAGVLAFIYGKNVADVTNDLTAVFGADITGEKIDDILEQYFLVADEDEYDKYIDSISNDEDITDYDSYIAYLKHANEYVKAHPDTDNGDDDYNPIDEKPTANSGAPLTDAAEKPSATVTNTSNVGKVANPATGVPSAGVAVILAAVCAAGITVTSKMKKK